MARLLTYNYLINKYIFNNQICKYNNHLPDKSKKFIFNNTDDVKNFIHYYHFKNHNFGDLNLTDEIVINDGTYNKTWLIAGFNTQLDSSRKKGTFNKHHLTLIPKNSLFTKAKTVIHNVDNNFKGFSGTKMFTETLPEINNNLSTILGSHLLEHQTMLSIDNSKKMESFTVKSMLLNYNQAFGLELPYQHYYNGSYSTCFKKYTNGDFDSGDDIFQLPLFKQDVKYRTVKGKHWWLRTLYSYKSFAYVYCLGNADFNYASNAFRVFVVRPFICFG